VKWLIVGPSEIYEHHRAEIRKELQDVKRRDNDAEIVTWSYPGTNVVVTQVASELNMRNKVFQSGKVDGTVTAPGSVSHALRLAVDYCNRGIVFLNIRSATAMEALFLLYMSFDNEKTTGKLWKYVPIDKGHTYIHENRIGEKVEKVEK
jgi:hypothetical protein